MNRAPQRSARVRILSAITAAVVLAVASIGGTLAATAAPVSGYPASGDTSGFSPTTLPLMTAGEAYTATITGPTYNSSWCWSISSGSLPAGISISPNGGCASSVTFSGTPEAGDFEFELRAGDMPIPEMTLYLTFSGTVESGKTPTTTVLSAPSFAAFDSIPVSATVTGNPTGTPTGSVEFRNGSDVLGTAPLSGGATGTVTLDIDLADVGDVLTITAHYLGDDDYDVSASTGSTVQTYAPSVSGTVLWNGLPVDGATVELLGGDYVADSATTNAAGEFVLTPGAITSIGDVNQLFVVQVTLPDSTVLYYWAGEANVTDIGDAQTTGPKDWATEILVERHTRPRFDDDGLSTPREGTYYSNGVTAESHNPVTFRISAGALPAGLTLNPTTGAVTGTPSACTRTPASPFPFSIVYSWLLAAAPSCDYDFTIEIDNDYGTSDERFTGTLLPAGVPPTWEDEELPEFRVDVAVDDEVLADGDPTITYSVTDGALPAGLTLDPATGAITGTPTTAGPYEFTITAENAFGEVDSVFAGDVAAAPDLSLVLEFEEGTSIEDAGSTISAEGLQVGSTYTLTMYSTPRVLYTGTVDATGGFTWLVALPADTPVGPHRLVLTGTAANGTPMSATAWFSLRADGRIGAVSYTGPVGGGLANTGVDARYATLAGAVLILLGVGAVVTTRRPRSTK